MLSLSAEDDVVAAADAVVCLLLILAAANVVIAIQCAYISGADAVADCTQKLFHPSKSL